MSSSHNTFSTRHVSLSTHVMTCQVFSALCACVGVDAGWSVDVVRDSQASPPPEPLALWPEPFQPVITNFSNIPLITKKEMDTSIAFIYLLETLKPFFLNYLLLKSPDEPSPASPPASFCEINQSRNSRSAFVVCLAETSLRFTTLTLQAQARHRSFFAAHFRQKGWFVFWSGRKIRAVTAASAQAAALKHCGEFQRRHTWDSQFFGLAWKANNCKH